MMRERALEKGIEEHRHWEGEIRETMGKGTYLGMTVTQKKGESNKKL